MTGGQGAGRRTALRRLRRRGTSLALLLLPFLLLFSSTRIYCENCRYTSIPGLVPIDGPRPASIAPAGSCCARAAGEAPAGKDAPPRREDVQHKRSPICIGKHLPLQGDGGAPAVAPVLARFARSHRVPRLSLHEAEVPYPRTSRAPPA